MHIMQTLIHCRYPLARARAGEEPERYLTAARTAFTDEILSDPGRTGLLFVMGETEPSLVYDVGNLAISLAPLICEHNILAGGTVATEFILSDMEREGLRPRLGGYIMYGSVTLMVINIQDNVIEFTLDQDDVFRMTDVNITMPEDQGFFNINHDPKLMANLTDKYEDADFKIRSREDCVVADVHRILKKGGVFIDTEGQFSAQFLLTPLAMIVSNAGGLASNGTDPIVDLKPRYQNETLPVLFGNSDIVSQLIEENLPRYYPR